MGPLAKGLPSPAKHPFPARLPYPSMPGRASTSCMAAQRRCTSSRGAHIGRHHIDKPVERPDPDAPLHEKVLHGGHVDRPGGLHHTDAAQHAHIRHLRQLPAGGKARCQGRFQHGHLFLPAVFRQDVQAGAGHGTGQGIAHEGGPVHEDHAVPADAPGHLLPYRPWRPAS